MKNEFRLKKTENMWGMYIPSFDNTGIVRTGFSTRVGSVDKGDSSSTLTFCNGMGIYPEDIGFCAQIHGNRVVKWDSEDTRFADGIMTNKPKVALTTFYADCVPLFFLDRRNNAIALSHSGWKGTVGNIAKNTLCAMKGAYGTRPEDCMVAIGPSIGRCCFEVDYPVAEAFHNAFSFAAEVIDKKDNGKYHIDLKLSNLLALEEAGVPEGNIYTAKYCTKCNPDIFFSYRGENGTKSRMAAVIMLL